jgi:hypothetical protein
VRSAVRLCDGVIGALNTFDGELTHVAAVHNYTRKRWRPYSECIRCDQAANSSRGGPF